MRGMKEALVSPCVANPMMVMMSKVNPSPAMSQMLGEVDGVFMIVVLVRIM